MAVSIDVLADARRLREPCRGYCRGCARETRHVFSSWATGDASENGVRPRGVYRACAECGLMLLALADVPDADGLCRNVLEEWLRRHSGRAGGPEARFRARATATGSPVGPAGRLDLDHVLGELRVEVWKAYRVWDPARTARFATHALSTLRRRVASIVRDELGDAENRPGGRTVPKAHAAATSLESLDRHPEQAIEPIETEVDWAILDERDRETALLIAIPIARGYSQRDAADAAGWTEGYASKRMRRLERVILAQVTAKKGAPTPKESESRRLFNDPDDPRSGPPQGGARKRTTHSRRKVESANAQMAKRRRRAQAESVEARSATVQAAEAAGTRGDRK